MDAGRYIARQRRRRTGLFLASAWIGHGLGGHLGGAFCDMTASYELSFLAAAMAGCLNLLLLTAVRRMTTAGNSGKSAGVLTGAPQIDLGRFERSPETWHY